MKALTVGSLFSGIGGLDLGFERAGFDIRWQVEIDPYCRKVLHKHWPLVPCYEDIRTVGAYNLEPVDVLVGGFPCQDISIAGKGAGIDGERSGLWREYSRLIGELRPRYAVVENVPAIVHRGLDRVLGDLTTLGYDAEWQPLPAAAFGAPHLRWRIFIVAYPHIRISGAPRREGDKAGADLSPVGGSQRSPIISHAPSDGCDIEGHNETGQQGASWRAVGTPGEQRPDKRPELAGEARQGCVCREHSGIATGQVAHTSSEGLPGRRLTAGLQATQAIAPAVFERGSSARPKRSDWWATEPNVGRVASGVSSRVDRLRGLGNAVVPQVAQYVAECVRVHAEAQTT